jgi:hypothetical protein
MLILTNTSPPEYTSMMKCDVCDGEMKDGLAINSAKDEDAWFSLPHSVDHTTIDFITVKKCQDCGRSLSDAEIARR